MLLMGFGTFLVGVLPTYDQIGVLAPIILVCLRLVQAIGLGGEWGGAVLMVAENVPPQRRGLFGSFVQLGNPMGRLAATGVFALAARLPEADFLTWGWRIPFLASAVLIVVGLIIRYQLSETPAFEKLREQRKIVRMPVLEAISTYRWETFIAIGLKITEVAWVGILSVFAVAYLTKQLGMSRVFILEAVTLATFVELFVMPSAGWLSDRIGREQADLSCCHYFQHSILVPVVLAAANRQSDNHSSDLCDGISGAQGIVFALHASSCLNCSVPKSATPEFPSGFRSARRSAVALRRWQPLLLSAGGTWPISLMLSLLGVLTLIAILKTGETSKRSMIA